jgi:DNA-binding GntR family transcriptional regulator
LGRAGYATPAWIKQPPFPRFSAENRPKWTVRMTPPKTRTTPRLRVVPASPAELSGQPIQRPTGLVEEVYTRVRAEIMSLAIPPDTRVTIEGLARRLGVSQTPVREALSMLEAKGLVTKQQFIGYCTAPILNRAQFEDIHEIRLLIEPHAARQAAQQMTGEQIGGLHRLVERMRPGRDDQTRSSYDLFAEQDSELHERIAMATGNMLIVESLARMHSHLHIFRLCFRSKIASDAHDEHAGLLAAIAARDGAAAEAAMRTHIVNSHARFVQFAQR